MGEVFLARDLTLDRPVAIKFLIAPDDEHARRRLLAEARSVAALDHPSICTVHEVVTDETSGDFIVMQFVEGQTLSGRLERGRLPPSEAMTIMQPLLHALTVAHRAGVVHRDIKPQNIILTPSGQPKLLDFGIAKRLEPEQRTPDAVTAAQLTMEGDVVGTPSYMSPEQIQGRPVDARSDLFSLGCVLHECLTGVRPFTADTRAGIIGKVLHVDPPPPSTVAPDVSPAYDALCADLLRKDPSERFQSADEVLGAIRGLSLTHRSSEGGGRAAPALASGVRRPTRRQWVMAAAGVAAIAILGSNWIWRNGTVLPEASPEAIQWFDRGVEKLREGSYAGARSALLEAVRLSPEFIQAHLRLAEAETELDNPTDAQQTLLRVNALLPADAKLPEEDQLRLDAVRSSVLRDHERAIAAYQRLADREPGVASRWLDVGRAEEDAGRRVAAMKHFEQAVKLDGQYAAAHQRLGVLQFQGGQSTTALASLDEAIRLHRAGSNVEGEAEATLRKATINNSRRESPDATRALDRVAEIAADPKFVSLRLRAQFERAGVARDVGRFEEAEKLSRDALDEAIRLKMGTVAADGLRGLATALMVARRYDDADVQLGRAIDVAVEQKADRAEMQARLQRAALRLAQGQYADAIAMVEAPLRFFTEGRYVGNEAEAKSILSRAHEALEQYDEARQLASQVLVVAESIEDPVLIGLSLDNLAGQAERLGQLPEALAFRDRLEKIHRAGNDHGWLAFDLVNRADLLIRLGRSAEGEALLDEVDKAIADGQPAYLGRRRRVAQMRALRASIEGRFGEVEAFSRLAIDPSPGPPGDTTLFVWALTEHAKAQVGTSRAAVDDIAGWPAQASSPALGREMTYWVARTLILRRRPDLARRICEEAWGAPPVLTNLELRWRLAALAAQATSTPGALDPATAATMRASARNDLQALLGQWSKAGAAYVARTDLTALRNGIS